MARGRMIDKTLSTSVRRAALHAELPELAEFTQALYPLLVAHSDDWGCQGGDAFTIKHKVDPTSPRPLEAFQEALGALHRVGLIVWYDTVGDGSGAQWVFITGWFAHQRLRGHTTDGRMRPSPPPPESFSKISLCAQKCPVGPLGHFGSPNRTELNRREQKGREQKRSTLRPPRSSSDVTPSSLVTLPLLEVAGAPVSPVVPRALEGRPELVFPVSGTSAARTWVLTAQQIAAWERAYPGVDVMAECRRALAYVEVNTKKTARGMPRYLVAWLNRTTNQPRALGRTGGVPLPTWAVKA
jgi:hypothetical protein